MKKTYQYIALAALVFGLAACAQEDDFIPQGNQKGALLTIASAGVTNLTTRATITTTEETDYLTGGSMGVFVTSETGGRYEGSNIKWTYNNGWNLDAATVVLYENDDTKQQIGAYYPYKETLTDGKYPVELPEAFDDKYEDYDYLYADYAALSSNPVTIEMNHLLSKVTVSVAIKGSNIDNDDAVESVSLSNVPRTADWAVPTATLSNYGSADQVTVLYANDVDNNETVDNYVGYAFPDEATTLNLRVKMKNGRIFRGKASISGGMTGGSHYTISLNVGKDKIEVSTVSIEPWGTGADIEDGVADESLPNIDGTEYASLTDIQDAVKNKLSQEGVTSVTIGGYLSKGMHAAIISAINEVKNEGAVTNGSLLAGSVTYTVHATFDEAVGSWTEGMTLTMLSDVTELSNTIETSANGLTLDLNGHKLEGTTSVYGIVSVEEFGLTVRDSKGGGNVGGKLESWPDTKLYFESGTVENISVHGDFIMTGGCVNDGIFAAGSGNRIEISGGEITGSFWAIEAMQSPDIIIGGCAKVNGGTGGLIQNDEGTTTITGGTFNADPSQWVNSDAYNVTLNEDGTYTVTAK